MKKLFIAISIFLTSFPMLMGGAAPSAEESGASSSASESGYENLASTDFDVELTPLPESKFHFALKTNMLFDAALVPNIGFEASFGRSWSLTADWMFARWSKESSHRFWHINGGEIEIRRWLNCPPPGGYAPWLSGHHFGLYAQTFTYDIALSSDKGQKSSGSPSYGFGISYGYSLPVSRSLNIDFTIGVGYVGGTYEKYHYDDGCYVWNSTNKRKYIGPSRAEISLLYIFGRQKPKGGRK